MCTDRQNTCNDQSTPLKGQVGGPGTCKCKAGFEGTPAWDGKTWDNPCVGKPCAAVPTVPNAITGASSNGGKYPSKVTYKCSTGFISTGETLSKDCRSDLAWQGDVACTSGKNTCSGPGQRPTSESTCVCAAGYEGTPVWAELNGTWTNPCIGEILQSK